MDKLEIPLLFKEGNELASTAVIDGKFEISNFISHGRTTPMYGRFRYRWR